MIKLSGCVSQDSSASHHKRNDVPGELLSKFTKLE